MRLSFLSVGLLALLTPLSAAWSKEDREIFRLRDEIAANEGTDVTFYEYVGVAPTANQDEISKAYKKRAKELHPDKVKAQLVSQRTKENKAKAKAQGKTGSVVTQQPSSRELEKAVQTASDRQARLGVVTNILRGPERDRYDYFLANGFPTWKGTEYYYNRYRPGLGTVLVGCVVAFCGGFHYLALYMSWRRQREFVERYIKFARHAAWGDNLAIPGIDGGAPEVPPAAPPAADDDEQQQAPAQAVNRKMRRMQERESRQKSTKDASKARTRRGRAQQQQQNSGTATPVADEQPSGPQGAKKRVVAENGKVLVVDSLGDVYLEQRDEDGNFGEFLLDLNELPMPTIRDTALAKLPAWAFRVTLGRLLGGGSSSNANADADELSVEPTADGDAADDSSSGPAVRTPSSTGSAADEDFEFLDKSAESLPPPGGKAAKATGSGGNAGKAKKRGNKKR